MSDRALEPLLTQAVPPSGAWGEFRRSASLLAGGGIAFALLVIALVSLVWTPYPPTAIDVAHKLQPPGASHLLG